jgi:ribosomal protein L44E
LAARSAARAAAAASELDPLAKKPPFKYCRTFCRAHTHNKQRAKKKSFKSFSAAAERMKKKVQTGEGRVVGGVNARFLF